MIRTPVALRLLAKTDRRNGQPNDDRPELGPCWEFAGAKNTNGYGVIKVDGKLELTHRVALALALGRPIADGMWSLHSCDNPPCVRPRHLREGPATENVADCIARGRHRGFEQVYRMSEFGSEVWNDQ